MLRGRSRLPVLAEISGPAAGRAWALRRSDFERLDRVLPRLEQRRVVLVAGEGEAPAVTAIALAAAAAAAGRRTILLDCDLGQPRLAAHLGLKAAPGLHEYLRWEAAPADVLQPLALAGPAAGSSEALVCVCAGRPATKAETLLGLQSFAHMLEKLRGAYELVLVLSPPVLGEQPGAGLAVARLADAVVAGLPGAEERSRDGRALRSALRRLPVPVLGAISVAA